GVRAVTDRAERILCNVDEQPRGSAGSLRAVRRLRAGTLPAERRVGSELLATGLIATLRPLQVVRDEGAVGRFQTELAVLHVRRFGGHTVLAAVGPDADRAGAAAQVPGSRPGTEHDVVQLGHTRK